MRRRAFIGALASAAAWPLVASGQQAERVRGVGVLMSVEESDPGGKTELSQFTQSLAESGWIDGENLRESMFNILGEEGAPRLLHEQHPYPFHEAPVVDASPKEQGDEQHPVLRASSGAEAQTAFDLELVSWRRTSAERTLMEGAKIAVDGIGPIVAWA